MLMVFGHMAGVSLCFMEVSICLVGDTSTLVLLLLSHNGDHLLISRLHVLAMLLLLFFHIFDCTCV